MANLRKARKELSSCSHPLPTVNFCSSHQIKNLTPIIDGKEAEPVAFHPALALTDSPRKSLTALKVGVN